MIWHGTRPWQADWSYYSRVLAFHRVGSGPTGLDVVYVAMNMYWDALEFELPLPPEGLRWHVAANTSMPAPQGIWAPGQEPLLQDAEKVWVGGRSILVLAAL